MRLAGSRALRRLIPGRRESNSCAMESSKKASGEMRWEAVDLGPFLGEYIADAGARVENLERLGGGASKEIWGFAVARNGSAPRRFVLRRSPHGVGGASLSIPVEFAVMRAAFEAGVRVPEPCWCARDADGNDFCILERIEGEALAPRLFREERYAAARKRMPRQLGELLAPIHRIGVTPELVAALGRPPEGNAAAAALEQYERIFRAVAVDPFPVFELAFRYLRSRLPGGGEVRLLHGDYRLGNVMFDESGIVSILDWELAHWGDPLEDLAWTMVRAWRFGRDEYAVAGLGPLEELIAGYEAAGGERVDTERLHWWQFFGNLRWGVITLIQAAPFLHGASGDLEKGVIGRRACEVEAELLNLMRS
jgi:aminoglycoside phosphotransferase (APT) family kinase protein